MKFSDKPLSQTLVALCREKGIEHIVISPGSRNAPLTLGFANDSYFKCFSIVDERAAAFFALGIAQQLQKPVAVVCTSGSALLNYYPAVAEAFYSDIPLLVFSADRPAEFIDIGDGQTIRQENIYEKHILYSANCQEGASYQLENEKEINIALNTAIELHGPVHINLPFSEPLYQTVDTPTIFPQNVPPRPFENEAVDLESYAEIWNESGRKMILVGTLAPNSLEKQIVEQLAQDKSVLVLTETTSNLHHPNFISAIDQLITPLTDSAFEALRPDVLLTFGGLVVSKRIKAFLRKNKPLHHWHVDPKKALDTYFVLERHIKMRPNDFFNAFLPLVRSFSGEYQSQWLSVKHHRLTRHKDYEDKVPYSDFKVFQRIFDLMPDGLQLQLSNSATIRYAQLFDIKEGVQVFCNRGTSGIDGSTSTAVGAAVASESPTLLITGDLSFFYDSNGLWNKHIPANFKIIVINNGGGGIFRILPGEKDTALFDTFFETKHELSGIHLAKMFGFDYCSVHNEEELEELLPFLFQKEDRPAILEIFTPD
ncbi:MAG TPA: 2-succinyl-5-enolpyruvyl-6-hydroxy-3-cyclohexene-1-carboxylic-acid synthase, partial [Flavobacteriaceae bacterium]|nr:2-succinyl-5-enolpyruvyl-6-hydroxy-3-cyclohexene-1-carboxylic-acid synthase [Flavobacteriaceae bacterium]